MLRKILPLIFLFILSGIALAKEETPSAIDFKGTTLSGEKIILSELRGKVVILDFWASWCGPCRMEMPFLINLYNKFDEAKNKQFEIIAINLDEHSEDMQKFVKALKTAIPFPVIPDPKGKLPELYQVKGMPTTVFIDKQGLIRFRHTGFTDEHRAQYVRELNLLLQEKQQGAMK